MGEDNDNMKILYGGYGVTLSSDLVKKLLKEGNEAALLMNIIDDLPGEMSLKDAKLITYKMIEKIIEETKGAYHLIDYSPANKGGRKVIK